MTDKEIWEMCARHARSIVETMLKEHFGERCEKFELGCPTCERWMLLDTLLENPYEE